MDNRDDNERRAALRAAYDEALFATLAYLLKCAIEGSQPSPDPEKVSDKILEVRPTEDVIARAPDHLRDPMAERYVLTVLALASHGCGRDAVSSLKNLWPPTIH